MQSGKIFVWRFAVYAKQPLFTIVILATLGLGIGATSAIFTLAYSVLVRPLDYPRAAELVSVSRSDDRSAPVDPAPQLLRPQEQTHTLAGVAAYWTPSVTISGPAGTRKRSRRDLLAHVVSRTGVGPMAGRGFVEGDDVMGARRVAVLGHGLWQRRFGGDPPSAAR